jgi:hypothetical protein
MFYPKVGYACMNIHPHTPAPEYCDEMTCEYQRIEKYPGDVFVYCESKKDCNFKQFGSGEMIWCNKPLGSHDTAIARAATLKMLDTLFNDRVIQGGRTDGFEFYIIGVKTVEYLRQQAGEQG